MITLSSNAVKKSANRFVNVAIPSKKDMFQRYGNRIDPNNIPTSDEDVIHFNRSKMDNLRDLSDLQARLNYEDMQKANAEMARQQAQPDEAPSQQ